MVRTCILTVDLEDYRRQELRDHRGSNEPPHPGEVERQLDSLLELFDSIQSQATFFTVGRLVSELSPGIWRSLTEKHRVGCHSFEHHRIWKMGPIGFKRDLQKAIGVLQDITSQPIISYRAPYFSSDHCDPWFGEILAEAGIRIDSSRRLRSAPAGFSGTLPLQGSGGLVRELPLASIGFGPKRVTVIGGTYMRVLPISMIELLMSQAHSRGFLPMIYLHPYDLDATAPPLDYERSLKHLWPRIGDQVRRIGRQTIAQKLRALASKYKFHTAESVLELSSSSAMENSWNLPSQATSLDVVVPMPGSLLKQGLN